MLILIHGPTYASHLWMAEQVDVFPRINNAIGVGQLYLQVGTRAVGEHYLGWGSSRSDSASIIDRVSTKDLRFFYKVIVI